MKKGDKKRQQKTFKRRAQVKQARAQEQATGSATALHHIHRAREYPIEGCWVQQGWEDQGLAVVVIGRRQPNGNIVFGNYLVDCYCLGLKDTYFNADIPAGQFQRDYIPKMFRTAGKPISVSPALAHEIVYGGIEYAAQFGFHPQRDYKHSQYILDPPDLHPRTGTVKFGKDGKPFFVAGPYDDVDAVLRQLGRTAGEGNYHTMFPIAGPSPEGWDDIDSDDMFGSD